MDKRFITMEQYKCHVCGKLHDTGSILINNNLQKVFSDRYTCTGYDFCPDCQKHIDDGYVILIEATNDNPSRNMSIEEFNRTGNVCYLKKNIAKKVFRMKKDMAFISQDLFARLKYLATKSNAQQ